MPITIPLIAISDQGGSRPVFRTQQREQYSERKTADKVALAYDPFIAANIAKLPKLLR
jgi:hypothetical protein